VNELQDTQPGESREDTEPDGWRRAVLDRVGLVAAPVFIALALYRMPDFQIGSSLLRDAALMSIPIAIVVAALWRRGPYRLRVFLMIVPMFALEFVGVRLWGYVFGTILIALTGVGLCGLLLGVRWAIAGWAVSVAILHGTAVAIQAGWLSTSFDAALVDPRVPAVAVRVSVSYAALSALLSIGVYAVVERLSASLRETQRALARATSEQIGRVRAEGDRRAVEAQFRSLVEHAPDSISIVDRDHRVLFSNHENRRGEDPSGALAESFVAPEHAQRVHDGIERVFAGQGPVSYDVEVLQPDRGHVWFSARVGPIVENGRIERAIVVATDISERRDLEAQLLQAQKLEAVGQLTGGVAHDFNNLLTVILGNLQLVASSLPEGDSAQSFIENARAAARRGAALTHRLLAFARRQTLQPRVLDAGELVAGMDDLLRRTLGETISIQIVRAESLWKCRIDPTQLENVILNLAINARDAMPRGGRLTIETSNALLADSTARQRDGAPPGPYVALAISDTGAGMSREIVEHAFEPFFTTKELGQGSGLGLSMVYGFVKQSGGHVEIESRPGEGTTLRVYLPPAESEAVEPGARVSSRRSAGIAGSAGRGELILVVEDDEHVRALTVGLLERVGYKTIDASSGQSALALLDRVEEIALVFTDVVLPGEMSGPQLARAVQVRRPGLPVLFTSGYSESALGRQEALAPGDEIVAKPFTQAELAERIRAALDVASARESRA
jgi:PAS domain S-box-containing protein